MEEIWKEIPGYEGYYEISNVGRVRSLTRTITCKDGRQYTMKGDIKFLSLNNKGYYMVNLYKNDKGKKVFVHRLVAEAFIPNPNNLPVVNHKDENPLNNNVDNLEWCTQKYNINYGTNRERSAQKHSNPIIMCDKETHEPIKEFLNMRIATEELGHPASCQSSICEVLKGRRQSALGYWWKYKNEKELDRAEMM